MDKHTPTPWIAEPNEKSVTIRILGMHGDPLRCRSSDGRGEIVIVDCGNDADGGMPFAPMMPEQVANAALIVKAVNSHASLLSTIKELTRALDEVMGWIGNWDAPFTEDDEWPETEHAVKAALSRAKSLMEQKP